MGQKVRKQREIRYQILLTTQLPYWETKTDYSVLFDLYGSKMHKIFVL